MVDNLKAEIVALVPRLRRFACALSGNWDEGDDLVQAACVKALARLDQFEHGTRLDSWMFRIIRNTHIDRIRKRKHERSIERDGSIDEISDGGTGAGVAEARMLLARVRDEMSALPPDQRSVLALVAIEGYTYKEAAAALEIPIGTVMSRLARARERLLPLVREGGQ